MTLIWHNPDCSKSARALELLQEAGVHPQVRLYLRQPPTVEELRQARAALGVHTIEMIRTGEPLFRDLDLADGDDEALLSAMAAHPALIERPIVFSGGTAVIGRPPEAVLDLLGERSF